MALRLLSSRMNLLGSYNKAISSAAIRGYATKKYTEDHQWISIDKDVGTVGISDYAQRKLGNVVGVQLPEVGTDIEIDGELGAIESLKKTFNVYSPVSGNVTAINGVLTDTPNLINKSPEGEGWLFKLKLANDDEELENLFNEKDYHEYCVSKEESGKTY